MCLFLSVRNRNRKWAKLVLSAYAVFFLFAKGGYAMQPPPPPLNLVQFKNLISEADIIAVGKIGRIKETDGVNGGKTKKSIEVILSVEKLLKGEVSGKTIVIKETYSTINSPTLCPMPRDEGEPKKTIIGLRAGPSCYHGTYKQGARIIVLLARIEGTNEYTPLGSGTYDKHLCEFLIEDQGIKSFYFKFAGDVEKDAGSEKEFIDLIIRLRESDSEEE
jgi:hypothetical protein